MLNCFGYHRGFIFISFSLPFFKGVSLWNRISCSEEASSVYMNDSSASLVVLHTCQNLHFFLLSGVLKVCMVGGCSFVGGGIRNIRKSIRSCSTSRFFVKDTQPHQMLMG